MEGKISHTQGADPQDLYANTFTLTAGLLHE